MCKDMWAQREETGDFTVSCQAETWRVHGNVLAAASPVMQSMVTGCMKEARQRRIEIQDVDPKGVQAMLEFIYLGELPKVDGTGLSVAIRLSHMYGLPELLEACGQRALEDISKDDMVEVIHAFQPLTDTAEIGVVFDMVCKKIQSNDELFKHLMKHL